MPHLHSKNTGEIPRLFEIRDFPRAKIPSRNPYAIDSDHQPPSVYCSLWSVKSQHHWPTAHPPTADHRRQLVTAACPWSFQRQNRHPCERPRRAWKSTQCTKCRVQFWQGTKPGTLKSQTGTEARQPRMSQTVNLPWPQVSEDLLHQHPLMSADIALCLLPPTGQNAPKATLLGGCGRQRGAGCCFLAPQGFMPAPVVTKR